MGHRRRPIPATHATCPVLRDITGVEVFVRIKRLTASERKLAEAFPIGERLRLGTGDPGRGATWGPGRTIRAEVIRELLVSATQPSRAGVPAIRITGARIVGALDLRFASVTHPLSLRSCHITGTLDLHGVRSARSTCADHTFVRGSTRRRRSSTVTCC